MDTLDIPDFSGQTFTILARTDLLDEVYSEMETGEIVNDAVYARNRNVSERLGIDINIINHPGDWANKDQFISYVSSSILAGDDAFQVVAGYMNYMPVTILDGLYLDINTLPYIDFGNEWWTNGFNDNATINGRLFMAMGDMCSSMLCYAFCGYANMKLLTDYGYSADELYQAVRDGKWTFDMMTGMAKNVSSDLNGDGVMDENDLHGVGMHNMPIRALKNAFGIDYTTRGPDGLPQIAMYGERLIGGFEKVLTAYKSDYWYDTNDSNKFKADKTLFYFDVLGATTALRDMQSNFSVVPMPKLDEQQNGYRTETVDTTSILMSGSPDEIYERMSYMANELDGMIDYFQLFNETDIWCSRKDDGTFYNVTNWTGMTTDYYNPERVEICIDKMRAAISAFRENAPEAQLVVNIGSRHYPMLDWYVEAGLEWDIIAFDIYDLDVWDHHAFFRLMEKRYPNYQFMVAECNYPANSGEFTEEEQAAWLTDFLKIIDSYESERMIAVMIYELMDEPNFESGDVRNGEAHFGIVNTNPDFTIGKPKAAYREVQKLLCGGECKLEKVYEIVK